MKLWRFTGPNDFRYARAGRQGGTWQEAEPWRRERPLVIEWLPGSDLIGDFTWPGLDTDIVVTDRVGTAMKEAGVTGLELAPVEMVETSKQSKRMSRKKQVKLPYTGPQLWDLQVTERAQLDQKRSTITVKQDGAEERFEVTGVERRGAVWDRQRMELMKVWHPRMEGQGLFVWTRTGIFRVPEFPAWVFCTDGVKKLIEEHRFTNVSFLEMGDVLNPSS
jgi:hypothetical protein